MIAIEEYYQPEEALSAKVEKLCAADIDQDRSRLHEQIMDMIIAYSLQYANVDDVRSLRRLASAFQTFDAEILRQVEARIRRSSGPNVSAAVRCANNAVALRKADILDEVLRKFSDVRESFLRIASPYLDAGNGYSPRMLFDTRATAALFAQIAFAHVPRETGETDCLAVDLGSGTGILTLAEGIACIRAGYAATLLGMEKDDVHVRLSKDILTTALRDAGNVTVHTQRENLASVSSYAFYGDFLPKGSRLRYWISETFGYGTPAFRTNDGSVEWKPSTTGMPAQHNVDPFPIVIRKTVEAIPDFLARMQRKEFAAFPNLMDGTFRPDELRSQLALPFFGGEPQPLRAIGNQFSAFESLTRNERWSSRGIVEKGIRVASGGSGNLSKDAKKKRRKKR